MLRRATAPRREESFLQTELPDGNVGQGGFHNPGFTARSRGWMRGSRGADLVCVLVGFAIRRAARVCWASSPVAGKSRGTDCTSVLGRRHQHHEGCSAQRFPLSHVSRPGDLHWINPAGQQQLVSALLGVRNQGLQLSLAKRAVRPGACRAGQAAEHPCAIPSTPTLQLPKPFPGQPPPASSHTPMGTYLQGSFVNPDVSFLCSCPGEGRACTPRFYSTRLLFISQAD